MEFRNKKISNQAYQTMYQSLVNCYNILQEEGTFSKINPNNIYTSYEIYKLGEKLQSKVFNSCYVVNLGYLKTDEVPKEFKDIAPYIVSYTDSINENVSDSLLEIQNNSSYFFSTNIT